MTETTNIRQDAVTNADEPLRLKCPRCGGGLNLKRRYLGVRGQCVHCQTPLTAIEEASGIQVVCHAAPVEETIPAPATVSHATVPSLAAPMEAPAPAAPVPDRTGEVAPAVPIAGHATTSMPEPGFPSFAGSSAHDLFPPQTPGPQQATAAGETISEPFPKNPSPGLESLLPGRDEENLFSSRIELPPSEPSPETRQENFPPFGNGSESRSPFLNEPDKTEIQPAWGAQIPRENHASISPFSTGSAPGEGLGESLFREKAVKESTLGAKDDTSPFGASPFGASPFASSPFAPTAPAGAPSPSPTQSADPATGEATPGSGDPAAPKRDCQEFVILDGDGRPMRPMSKEEEESFATNFFKYENSRTKPTWVARLRKKLIRMLIFFCVVGALGAGASFFVPKETLVVWKEKVIKWLEPGMAIFDYLPDRFRPEWLPQTDFGIDAGTDENGQPKKKLNAFEGLEKLKGDVGDMRGAAEKQLEELNNF